VVRPKGASAQLEPAVGEAPRGMEAAVLLLSADEKIASGGALTLTATASMRDVGGESFYTLLVTNVGPSPATAVTLTDDLLDHLEHERFPLRVHEVRRLAPVRDPRGWPSAGDGPGRIRDRLDAG
jgi:uncharacterized repeat protein (TIGR01451 family)